ncbi:MAG: PEP-CTERM system TPR-repeat protein PrsT, partial [Rhodocyclaceae bacterium]|nr:PEP-CTERM system TPR-repeat protein PrsT [Rhodocyclaceae bacterium]
MKSNRTFGRKGFVCAVLAAAALVACGGDSDEKIEESARGYVAAKDYNAATIQLKTLLQRNPNSANGRFLLGKTLLETGDPTAALVELQKAQELSVPDEQVLPEMARAMILLGQQIKVISQYAQTTLRDPAAQADLATSVAVAYALQNEPAKSLQQSQRALQSQPMYAPAVILQARLKVAENDLPGALLLLDEVLARNATDEKAGILKGDLLWRGKRDEAGALAAYNKVLEGTPNAVAAHVALIGIHSGAGRTTEARAQFDKLKKSAPNHPETLFIDAQFALQDGKPAVAREIAERMLKAMPENPRVLLLAAAAEYRLRSYVQAEGLLGRVLKVAPGHLPARHLLAQTYLRTGQANKALEALGSLIDSPKADGGSLALAGEAYMQIGDTKRADQAFQRAGKAAPDDTRVRTAVALAQFARGDTGAAVSALESIAAEDKGPRADFALVSARMQAGDTGGALKAVDAIAKKMPDKPLPDLLRGRVLLAKKDAAGAKAAFNAALAKDPKYFPAVSALAGLELVANNKDGARKRL